MAPSHVLFSLLWPAVALRVQYENSEQLVIIPNPKFTQIDDPADSLEGVSVNVTPVKLVAFPGVTIMTGIDKLSQSIQLTGQFETGWVQTLLTLWREHGQKGNFLDVGANMGAFTLPMASALKHHPDAVQISVEALPLNRKLLRQAFKENNLHNVHLYEYAVGNYTFSDSSRFASGGANSGHAGLSPKHGGFLVPMTTLDAIYSQDAAMKKIFAMKMDIEGAEAWALDGGATFLANYAPCYFLVEINRTPKQNMELHNKILSMGYEQDSGSGARNRLYKQADAKRCVDRL